jgi:hypothetical protein
MRMQSSERECPIYEKMSGKLVKKSAWFVYLLLYQLDRFQLRSSPASLGQDKVSHGLFLGSIDDAEQPATSN